MRGYVSNVWAVYILTCADGTLYTGVSKDPATRLKRHNRGLGAKYTKQRRPCVMTLCRGWFMQRDALRIELLIKKLPRKRKILFLQNFKGGVLLKLP